MRIAVMILSFWLIANAGVFLWVLYAKLEHFEAALSKCSIVEINKRIWPGDPKGRVYRLNFISLVLDNPFFFIAEGTLILIKRLLFRKVIYI